MSKNKLSTYQDGAIFRAKNKRVQFIEIEGKVKILFDFADEDPNKPACSHECIKNKIRRTRLNLTTEGMEMLVTAYFRFRQAQKDNHEKS